MPARPNSRRAVMTADQKFRAAVEDVTRQILGSRKPWPLRKVRRAYERAYVAYILESEGADRVAAAATLDIGFSTLKEKIRVE